MIRIYQILIIAVILSGCSANNQLRRAKKLIQKAELNGAVWSSDTAMVRVPVILTETRVDSLFIPKPGDTVVISKDRLKIVYIDLPGDSVFIEGECAADTVFRDVPVTVTKVLHAPKSGLKWWWLIVAFAAGIVISFFASLKRG